MLPAVVAVVVAAVCVAGAGTVPFVKNHLLMQPVAGGIDARVVEMGDGFFGFVFERFSVRGKEREKNLDFL